MNFEEKGSRTEVTIYTDGSCLGNGTSGAVGGYCGIIIYSDGSETIISNGEENTTNNRMEMKSIIEAIKVLPLRKNGFTINLYSDSKITVNGINDWLDGWIIKNWKNSKGKAIANQDLWKEYLFVSSNHNIKATWIKAHDGDVYNERCDVISRSEAEKLKEEMNI